MSSLRCLQINLRHSKAAARNLSQLILHLDIDVVLIQEPSASFSLFTSKIEVKNVPVGYSSFHNLSSEHAFGAPILVKSSLHATLTYFGASNSCCGISISPNLFFSLYCRPSLGSIPAHVRALLNYIPPFSKKYTILSGDVNAKNKVWNSARTDDCGLELEHIFRESRLSIANVDLISLPLTRVSSTSLLLETESVCQTGRFLTHPLFQIIRLSFSLLLVQILKMGFL